MGELAVLYTSACFMAAVPDLLLNVGKGLGVVLPPFSLFAGSCASWLFFRLFLRKERSGNLVLLSGTLWLLGITLLCIYTGVLPDIDSLIITVCSAAILVYRSFRLSGKRPQQFSLISRMEGSLTVMVLFMLPDGELLCCTKPVLFMVGALFCAVAAVWNRIQAQNQAQNSTIGVGKVTAAATALLAAAAGAAALLADPLSRGFATVLQLILTVLRGIAWLVASLFALLARLFPASEPGKMDADPAQGFSIGLSEELAQDSGGLLPVILAVVLALLFLFAVIAALRKLRLKHLRMKVPGRTGKVIQKKSHFSGLQRLLWKIRFRLRLLRERNTVMGAFRLLEWQLRKTPAARKKGETPRQFLIRCAGYASLGNEENGVSGEQPDAASALLLRLAEMVDACCYADTISPATAFPEAGLLRRWAWQIAKSQKKKKSKRSSSAPVA